MPELPRPTGDPRAGIDPRGPRFGAALTATLLLGTLFLALTDRTAAATGLLGAIALLFAWGAFAGIRRHPFGRLYAAVLHPRLAPPAELEDPAPPTFAQGVGLVVTGLGLLLALLGVPLALEVSSAAAFVAAFLNAAFGYCLGCQIYLLLLRAGVFRSGAVESRG